MTPKENLYKKYIGNYNKLADLKGTSHYQWGEDGHNLYEFFNSYTFKNAAKGFTMNELKSMIDDLRIKYIREQIEAFFVTKRGMEYKKEIEEKIEVNRRKYTLLVKDINSTFDSFIKEWLGKEWGVSNVYDYGMNIGLVDKKENGVNDLWNNGSFYVYYDKQAQKRVCLTNNNNTIFVLGNENIERQSLFMSGMAEFVKNTKKVEELVEYFDKFNEKRFELYNELSKLQELLKNPPIEIDEI